MILLRHGQTIFNVHYGERRVDPGVEDPGLTDHGRTQTSSVPAELSTLSLTRIVVSPYRRTLETAAIVNEALNLPIVVDDRVRERAGFSCDIGTVTPELSQLWPDYDFSHLSHEWWVGPAGLPEPEPHLEERCEDFRSEISAAADWETTLVITHWGVIRALTGQTVGNCAWLRYDPVNQRVADRE